MTDNIRALKKLLRNYFYSGHSFNKNEHLLKFQFQYLNTILLLSVLLSPTVAFLHKEVSPSLFYSDMAYATTCLLLILFMRLNKTNLFLSGTIFIFSFFIAVALIFFTAGDDPSKVIWAPILLTSSLLLKKAWHGIFLLLAILITYFGGYFYLGEEGIFYSFNELLLVTVSLIAIAFILAAFKYKNSSDNNSLLALNEAFSQKAKELKLFNQSLELKIAEGLLESQNKTKTIQRYLDLINEHIIIVNIDLKGYITNVSQAYSDLTGYSKKHFISEPFSLLFDKDLHSKEIENIWRIIQEKHEYTAEVKNEDSKQQIYWLDTKVEPEYTLNDEHIGYIAISHDITNKKLVLQQQEQLIAQSRHATMGEMISMIAHQWRQPLATIAAISSSISLSIKLKRFSPEKIETSMQDISHQIQYLSSTVNDFRNFFKPNKGFDETNVHEIVEEALKLLEHRFKKLRIQLEYKNTVDITTGLYRNELIQVFINIFNNASDALQEKEINDPHIHINEYIENDYAIIEISDNAGGIDDKTLARVFDPYFSTKLDKNGTGLGLYMSKTIVEDHQKGRITAFNNHEGAVFQIMLPLTNLSE